MTTQFQAAEQALRAAFGGKPKARPQVAHRTPKITVLLSARPADGIGPSVYLEVTTGTISSLEAEMEALREARVRGLRQPVVLRVDTFN